MDSELHIRTMQLSDIELALDWAAREGWNPGLHDAICFAAADPEGFLVGSLNDQPVAALSVVKYGKDFSFLGLYIVAPEYRGQGYGWTLWQAGMQTLSGRTVGLDGVLAQQANYKKSGFQLAYRNIRFAGRSQALKLRQTNHIDLKSIPLESLCRYDERYFPAERSAFLKQWISQQGTIARGVLEGGELVGYGVIRPCREGFKIGPLFAERPEVAESLYSDLTGRLPDQTTIFLDVPEVNPAAVALAERHELQMVFETARMYAGSPPQVSLNGVYGVTTFELG